MTRLLILALAALLAVGGCTATHTTGRASLQATSGPGRVAQGVEASLAIECSWGRPGGE